MKFSSIVLEKMNGAKSGDFTKKAIVKGILLIIAQSRISLYHSHTHSGAGCCWLIFCQPVVHRLLSYGNENDNGYDFYFFMLFQLFTLY